MEYAEKTREELREDGFLITGDLGFVDDKGYLQIVGRNDLIIAGGYNIYPKEIELILDDQPGVLESAVIGVQPDFGDPWWEFWCLIIAACSIQKITDSVAASLAKFKQPRRLVIVDALLRNAKGKVQKNILRDTCGNNRFGITHTFSFGLMSWHQPVSPTRPAAAMPASAAASSLSDVSPEMPTAPISAPD